MSGPASLVVCAGCGRELDGSLAAPLAFRCPEAGGSDDVDHVLQRVLDPRRLAYPRGRESNPFLRYRTLLRSHHVALAGGLTDEAYRAIVEELDRAIAQVDGHGFEATPCFAADPLAARLGLGAGQLWVKDETGNVSGSHKARHLMGILLDLRVAEEVSGNAVRTDSRLAIASCGNAALAAAVLASAAGRPLDVFVPEWAEASVVARLRALGARVETCRRQPGVTGDPCYHRFQAAVRDGAVPFCCQGPDNGLTIEGGSTLAWELLDAFGERPLDRLFVQVGGGALASACAQGFADAVRLGRIRNAPRLHAVQTAGGHPLKRAYDRVLERILRRLGESVDLPTDESTPAGAPAAERLAERVRDAAAAAVLADELRWATTHRSQLMWPWETEPRSLATGILDDETYDWLAIVEAMLTTGGYPIVVDEATIAAAHAVGRATTGIDVDPAGTAGLAGLMHLIASGVDLGRMSIAVVFTGARRG